MEEGEGESPFLFNCYEGGKGLIYRDQGRIRTQDSFKGGDHRLIGLVHFHAGIDIMFISHCQSY